MREEKKMAKPTYQDATLMVQLAQVAALRDLGKATEWLWSDQFIPDYTAFVQKYPHGSEEYGKVRTIAVHYEMIATLWKHGLIHEDLLFDWIWVTGLWDRMQGFVLGTRQEAGEPSLGENFEAMAKAQPEWKAKRTAKAERRKMG
jgi:hypothetical protein